ncbi:MAG: HDIG domain-containing protein [Gallionella sp.]|nr:HDIG domain-containing protein [Gallionella sp.]
MYNVIQAPDAETLSGVYRIVSISCLPMRAGCGVEYRVELFRNDKRIAVEYTRSNPDIRLKVDSLVSVRWKFPMLCDGETIRISRLVLLEIPLKTFNPFETVPHGWVKDRQLVERAAAVFNTVPDNLRHLLVSVLWNGTRFRQFCECPSSLGNHHAQRNGNLRHTVEVAETVNLLAEKYPLANRGISLAAAFLHDVGKAAEYSVQGNHWAMSDRGRLIGHRHTVIEWIAQAMATNRIVLQERHYLSLLHALTSAPNAQWLGIRTPVTPEATLLSMADRLSGESELTGQLSNREGGWGSLHPHRKSKPFTLPDAGARFHATERG